MSKLPPSLPIGCSEPSRGLWRVVPAPVEVRTCSSGALTYSPLHDRLFLFGGFVEGCLEPSSKLWTSRANGRMWEQVDPEEESSSSGDSRLSGRWGHSLAACPSSGILWVAGGHSGLDDVEGLRYQGYLNDVWLSADEGKTWKLCSASPPWCPRADFRMQARPSWFPEAVLVISGGFVEVADVKERSRVVTLDDSWALIPCKEGPKWVQLPQETSSLFPPSGGMQVHIPDSGALLRLGDGEHLWRSDLDFSACMEDEKVFGALAQEMVQQSHLPCMHIWTEKIAPFLLHPIPKI